AERRIEVTRELVAAVVAIVIFFVAVALTVALQRLKLGDNLTMIALILIPLVVYGVVSGRITEFAAGGISAKMKEVGKEKIKVTPLGEEIQKVQVVSKGSLQDLDKINELEMDKPVALTLRVGPRNFYSPNVLKEYIASVRLIDRDATVLLL